MRDRNNQLPLITALAYDRQDCCELLLAAGADPNAVDRDGKSAFQVARDNACRHLLVAAGASIPSIQLSQDEMDFARARIVAAKNKIEAARLKLTLDRRALVVKKALPMCFALQELQLPAFVTLAILDELLPGRLRDLVPMHFKWDVITAIKHFHERAQQ